jgi:hypothetical protein
MMADDDAAETAGTADTSTDGDAAETQSAATDSQTADAADSTGIDRRTLAGGATFLALVLVALVVAAFFGVGPAPGGEGTGEELTDFPTATPDPAAAGDSAPAAEPPTSTPLPPFTFAVESISECGQTCRDVTVELRNNRDGPATDITIYTRIFTGEATTSDDALVWEGKHEVGRLAGEGSTRSTERISLSLRDGLAVQQADGWITILTTVQSAEETVTFTRSRQVA